MPYFVHTGVPAIFVERGVSAWYAQWWAHVSGVICYSKLISCLLHQSYVSKKRLLRLEAPPRYVGRWEV